jgi:hypothetical protein
MACILNPQDCSQCATVHQPHFLSDLLEDERVALIGLWEVCARVTYRGGTG